MRTLRGLAVAIISAALLFAGLTSAQADVIGWGGRDVTFTPASLNGSVNTIIQLKVGANAGKYLIGGSFTNAGGNADIDYVARLNADGTIDAGFTPPALSAGTGTCSLGDGTNGPTTDVRSLLEVQTASGTNAAGSIYIGGNFTTAGATSKMDYLVRVTANGTLDSNFYPTNTGASDGTVSYTNCVYTMFTAEGSGSTLSLVVGTQTAPFLSKKVFDTGATAAGFTAPTFSGGPVVTGLFCPAADCGADRYVLGGGFASVNSDTKLSRLVRLRPSGSISAVYPTTNGSSDGTPLFDNRVNSVAITSSGTSILVGGRFTGKLAKVSVDFVPSSTYIAPSVSDDVWSVAVDPSTTDYVYAGDFIDSGDYPACDYVCMSDSFGQVVNVDGRSYFAAPPPTGGVRTVSINGYTDANEGKYLIGGVFTDLGGNTGTDYVARLNQATPASITLNSSGGTQPNGADGIKTVYSNGQWQVYRENTGQLYEPNSAPPERAMFNQVALSLSAPGGGGYAVGPSSLRLSNQNIDFANGYLYRPWDSVTATGGSTGTGSGTSDLTVEVDGRTYVVHMTLDYTYPDNHIRQTFTVDIPAGNTYNVKLYNLYDSYLGGSDNGPGFYNAAAKTVGVSGQTVYMGLRYVSGQDWAAYMSAYYYDVVFGNDLVASAPTGPGYGEDLDNSIVTDPTNDNGFGINWDFGSSPGTTAPVVDDFIIGSITAPTAAPTTTAGQVKVDWTDPIGITPAPDSYVITAYDGGAATAHTCTASAPATTCTVSGLDPAIPYRFLVDFRSSGSTVFNMASNPVHAQREVTVKIWGDPTSTGPAVTFSRTLGDDPDTYMAGYTGLTVGNGAVPIVTPECPSGTITPAEATPGTQPGEYTAVVGCQDGLSDISSYTTKIAVSGGSCLVAAGLPAAGDYKVGTSQESITGYGTNLPDGTTPAFKAEKDATPMTAFDPTATAGVYLPATRACKASSAPFTAATSTAAGAITVTDSAPLSNGGSAPFAEADLGAVNGYNRVLTEPTNTTGTGGGYRSGYFRCGVTNASGVSVPCQLGGTGGVRVTSGGINGIWNPASCAGQTVGFRSRYMTQMGYGLWSDVGNTIFTGGCS